MTAPTHVAAYYRTPGTHRTAAAPETAVWIDGFPAPRARLRELRTKLGEAPRAAFDIGLGAGPAAEDDLRLEAAAPTVRAGQIVHARLLRADLAPGPETCDLVVFEGRVTRIEMALGPDGERLAFEAEDLLGGVRRRRVGGQRIRTAGGDVKLATGLGLVFNPDGRPNASSELYTPLDGPARAVFAPVDPGQAVPWTLDEAVAYVLAEVAEPGVSLPERAAVLSALPAMVLMDVDLEGRTFAEAVEALLALVGGRLRVNVEPGPDQVSRRVEIWLPTRAVRTVLSHQPVGENYAPDETELSDLAAEMSFEASPRRYVATGDRKLYESTFALVPGWDDNLAGDDPRDFGPSTNANFDSVRDVYRKWVLNEAGDYTGTPYSRGPAYDLAILFEGEPYARRHRRFLACLSRDALGRSRGVACEVSLDGGATWQVFHARIRALEGEAGIYVADDPLPPAYFHACATGTAKVRVTATLASDSRVRVEWSAGDGDDLPGRTRAINLPGSYRYRKVAPTSRFAGDPADEVDDTPRLAAFLEQVAESDSRCPVPTTIRLPQLALGHRPGTRVSGLRGRWLWLTRAERRYLTDPVIESVRYRLSPVPETEMTLA